MTLREIRESKNMTLKELSRRTRISISELSEIETGKRKPRATTVILLSRALGAKFEEIEKGIKQNPNGGKQ